MILREYRHWTASCDFQEVAIKKDTTAISEIFWVWLRFSESVPSAPFEIKDLCKLLLVEDVFHDTDVVHRFFAGIFAGYGRLVEPDGFRQQACSAVEVNTRHVREVFR